MLVFISDIHLTDGSSGETMHPGAFRKFTIYLQDMVETAKPDRVEIVMVGDVFDVIRSDHWLSSGIRPWSKPDEKDGNGEGLEDYTKTIVEKICSDPRNKSSLSHLHDFKDTMGRNGVDFQLTYIVGNHDWLINRYPATRERIAEFLGFEDPGQFKTTQFPTEKFWRDYEAMARHGDIYDAFNFDGDRDTSSLGDAIVIDLVNRFPAHVENEIGAASDPELIEQLREIDNVRPLFDIPLWVHGACRRARTPEIAERVKEIWNDLVDDFLNIDFVKMHDRAWRFDVVDALQLGLGITKMFSFKNITRLPLKRFQTTEADYKEKAFNELRMKKNEVEFVIYGHTHRHRIQALDRVPLQGRTLRKTYLNTGTWRPIHEKAAYDVENQEFLSWKVMTFIALYLKGERRGGSAAQPEDRGESYRFEVWNGALG